MKCVFVATGEVGADGRPYYACKHFRCGIRVRTFNPPDRIDADCRGWAGFGDAVAWAASLVRVKPCAACKKRQELLIKAVPFTDT